MRSRSKAKHPTIGFDTIWANTKHDNPGTIVIYLATVGHISHDQILLDTNPVDKKSLPNSAKPRVKSRKNAAKFMIDGKEKRDHS